MKKFLSLIVALMMLLSLAACGGTGDGGTTTGGGGGAHTPSTDYFWEKYDFAEEWMLPDDGVYTRYTYIDPNNNSVGNEALNVYVYDITEAQISAYIQKIEAQGYTNLIGDSYTKSVDGKTAMIEVKHYLEDGYIIIVIDPSI